MPRFAHGPVELDFLDEGQGESILLVHGFASTKEINWVQPGWIDTLTRAGRRVVALDNRGHGQSTKLYHPRDFHTDRMAEDAGALLDYLGISRADLMGYSMGARICAFLAVRRPALARSLIIGGLGIKLVTGVGLPESIAEALEAPSLEDVHEATGKMFRAFAEQTKADRKALAACIRGSRQTLTRSEAASINAPVLIAVGSQDPIAGSAEDLAAIIPRAQVLEITGRDHMLAVGDKIFKQGTLKFLLERA